MLLVNSPFHSSPATKHVAVRRILNRAQVGYWSENCLCESEEMRGGDPSLKYFVETQKYIRSCTTIPKREKMYKIWEKVVFHSRAKLCLWHLTAGTNVRWEGRIPWFLDRMDGLKITAGEKNILLSTGNETSVMRKSVCSYRQVKRSLRLTMTTLAKPASAFWGVFWAYTP